MKTSPNDVSNQEILEAINGLKNGQQSLVESQQSLANRMTEVETTTAQLLETMNTFAGSVDARFDSVDRRLTRVEALMVTKDYLDEKLANQYSDIMQHTRREIEKATR